MRRFRRWCWPCLAVGFGLAVIAEAAFAAPAGYSAGPSWSHLAQYAIGLVAVTVGAYARRIEARVEKSEARVDTLAGSVAGIRETLIELRVEVRQALRGME